LFHPVRSYY